MREYLERVLVGDERGWLSWVIRALLWPFSVVHRIGLAVYLVVYSIGPRQKHRLPVPVVSVGNLTFGGTGKTPAVEAVCRILIELGHRPVILSRGHGGSARGPMFVSDGGSVTVSFSECGDEPLALAGALPGVPVVVGKDRRKSGEIACARFSPDVIVLDDGLQYWQLSRDLDIVVVDASRPFGSGHVMPMGDLREPVGGLRRAGVVLVNGARDLAEDARRRLLDRIARLAPDALVFECARRPARLIDPGGAVVGLESLRDRDVIAFCGIGRPESFFDTLESLGARVRERLPFADHHRYSDADLALVESRRESLGVQTVVTTEKDFARLARGTQNLYVLSVELEIEDRPGLAQLVARVVDRTRQETPAQKAAD